MSSQILRARLIFPVDAPPIWNGSVEIVDGVITAVSSKPMSRAVDLGNVALIPGLVNAHTHLEFSDLSAPLGPARPFTKWLQAVVQNRRMNAGLPRSESSVTRGQTECRETGTALAGDIVTGGWSPDSFDQASPVVVAFHESLGLRPERKDGELARARQFLEGRAADPPHILRGLSPHAPYSVHPDLVRGLTYLAREFAAPIAMHLAETREELELLREGRGEFVEFLTAMGVWDPNAIPHGSEILDYLRILAEAPRGLVVHGNYLAEREIEFLQQNPQLAVVYCPRTHAYFGHAPHPWRELLEQGVSIALGTDSRASNPDLSLWKELQFLHDRFPEVDPQTLLELATISGAKALGLDDAFGSLAPGKRAAIAVARLPSSDSTEPFELLLGSPLTGYAEAQPT